MTEELERLTDEEIEHHSKYIRGSLPSKYHHCFDALCAQAKLANALAAQRVPDDIMGAAQAVVAEPSYARKTLGAELMARFILHLSASSEQVAPQENKAESASTGAVVSATDLGVVVKAADSSSRSLPNNPAGAAPDSSERRDVGAGEVREWRCFHCDEVFTDKEAAADHFGVQIDGLADETGCKLNQIDGGLLKMLREAQEELSRYHMEDNEMAKTFYALGADHRTALVREEEKGYARGLADGRSMPAPAQEGG